jgi:lipid II:glycine glycyltransferase (peptidoglycan interpeptide bridge formation enzyme)
MEQNIKFEEVENEKIFNPIEMCSNVPFTQAYFYGEVQKGMGRKVRRFILRKGSELVACFQTVKYSLPFGKNYLYIAYGPVVKDPFSKEFLQALKEQLKIIAAQEKSIFIRLDFSPPVKREDDLALVGKFFKKAPLCAGASASFQPRVEWVIDLKKSEDELLKNMHHKARYNIGLSKRKGVQIEVVKENLQKYFEDFYFLLKATADRGHFELHPKVYYEKMLEISELYKNGFFVIARYNEKILVINFVLHYGGSAIYAFGGSTNEYRELMPAYLVQWESILEAKNLGLKFYSFGNINTEKYKNSEWEGFSVFKKKFGGEVFEHSDFYDLVASPFWYWVYNLRKRLA